jgi:hypothetical protein
MLLFLVLATFSQASSTQDICVRAAQSNDAVKEAKYGFDDEAIASSFLLEKSERVDIACQLKTSLLRQYSAIVQKQERIQIKSVAHLDSCILEENKTAETSRLDFLDRMKKCVAAFQDTHMGASPRLRIPGVFLPINLQMIEGKARIVSKSQKMITWIETKDELEGLNNLLPLGAEVLTIDGENPQEAAKKLAPYIAASSDKARMNWAMESLTRRSFLYPKSNTVDFKIKYDDGKIQNIRLPWLSSSSITNAVDANMALKKIGIPSLDSLKWNYNPAKLKWEASGFDNIGLDNSTALFSNTQEWLDDDSSPALRIGEVLQSKDRVFCYMQLLTFSTEKLKNGETAKPFIEPIKEFLASCEQKQLPLVFDLRMNGGGVASYPSDVMALLGKKGESYTGKAVALRATKLALWQFSQLQVTGLTGAQILETEDTFEKLGKSLADSLKRKDTHTDVIVSENLVNPMETGFNQKIVALITPDCVSACDNMAALLKSNSRATLIGSHTNGTGAGFITVGRIGSDFADTYQILSFGIPTSLFGIAPKGTAPGNHAYEASKEWLTENKPAMADVNYEDTLADVSKNGKGWADKSVEVLFGSGKTASPSLIPSILRNLLK